MAPGPLQIPQSSSCTDAVVDVVADAIAVGIGRSNPTTVAEGVESGFRRSRSLRQGCRASAVVDGARAVADPAVIQLTDAVVDVVADAIAVGIGRSNPTTVAEGVESGFRRSRSLRQGCRSIRTS